MSYDSMKRQKGTYHFNIKIKLNILTMKTLRTVNGYPSFYELFYV